jgi:hypothetical protein
MGHRQSAPGGVQQDGKIVIDYVRSVMVKTHTAQKDIFPGQSDGGLPNRGARNGVRVLARRPPHATRFSPTWADVIKVERPGTGDVIRTWDTAVKGLSSGTVWVIANKRSLAIDLKQQAGLDILKRLASRADVFLENFAPGVAARMGLGATDLTTANPRLIYCSFAKKDSSSRRQGVRRADQGIR